MTYYMQGVLRYTPIEAGLGSLPMTGGISPHLPVRHRACCRAIGAKPLMAAGSFSPLAATAAVLPDRDRQLVLVRGVRGPSR